MNGKKKYSRNQKEKVAIAIIFVIVVCSLIFEGISNLDKFSEKKITLNESFTNSTGVNENDVLFVLSDQSGISLVNYNDKTEIKQKLIIQDENGDFYSYNHEPNPVYFKSLNQHLIVIRKAFGKICIKITDSFLEESSQILDNANSQFLYSEKETDGVMYRCWFLVMDELPKDYKIIINGEEIQIK